MTASYSASLLEVRNPNLSAYSMSIPSGEVRIRPAPLPCTFEAPSTESFQMERSVVVWASLAGSPDVNSMTKSSKTCPLIAVFGLYLMSNSLSSMATSSVFRRSLVYVTLASSGILLELLWYEPGNKGGVSELRLPKPKLIFPSLGTSPPLLSKLGCNSKLGAALVLCL